MRRCFSFLCSANQHCLFVLQEALVVAGGGRERHREGHDVHYVQRHPEIVLFLIKIVLYQDSVLNKAILQNLLSGLATVPKAAAKAPQQF